MRKSLLRSVIRVVTCASAVALVTSVASAQAVPELTVFLESQISAQQAALAGAPGTGSPQGGASFDESWYYRRFWLRVRMPTGIDVPWALKLQVIPEVELLWERPYPAGWSAYKPKLN